MAEKTTKRPRRATKRSAASDTTAETKADSTAEDTTLAKKTTKRAPRKATKKAAKKAPAKKAAKKSAPKQAAKADPFAQVRENLGEKMRVHQLAKDIERSTKELTVVLAELGINKTAASNITKDEAVALLDRLAKDAAGEQPVVEEKPAKKAPAKKTAKKAAKKTTKKATKKAEPQAEADFTEDEKLRHRIEKNVENEISQIEEKVDRELSGKVEEAEVDEDKLRHRIEKNVENEITQIEEKVEEEIEQRLVSGILADEEDDLDFSEEQDDPEEETTASADDFDVIINLEEAAELEKESELLEDVEDEITPAPATTGFATPVFMAPTISQENQAKVDAAIAEALDSYEDADADEDDEDAPKKRRRGRRGTSRGRGAEEERKPARGRGRRKAAEKEEEVEQIDEPMAIKGSTRLEAQRRRRNEMREESRKKRHVVSEAEFLARRESVTRTMVVRERERGDHPGVVTQVGVLEDDMLVEHFVTSDTQASMVGNIYLGRVQNVLPSMEAAFIDIGKGRNGVLYAGEVNWRQAGLGGRNRKIEQALKSGDQVLVQVSKDPIGHKGARLTTQISLAGRYLVYVPGGRTAGISRKLPAPERKRLKEILRKVVPGDGGVIIRTAAEGVSEESIAADVGRLHTLWEQIQERTTKEKESKGAKPQTMYEEPNMLVKVVRDLFNEDFTELVVDGKRAWNTVHAYISSVAPELADRLTNFNRGEHDGQDAFKAFRVDEQIQKALSRKVWLPSGGTLVIDRTEAMTVIDVNTGKFTGAGGNLEETVTKNNLEAAEEIVRQMRLRDLGGMIVVDFIDMVLPENQDLVLRRLKETLGRDRTRHQISEVTSLGLVQMTRKRLGTGLLETFATDCEHCEGRGVIIHDDPVEHRGSSSHGDGRNDNRKGKGKKSDNDDHGVRHQDPTRHPAAVAMHHHDEEQQAEDENKKSKGSKSRRGRKPKEEAPSIEELAAAVVVSDDVDESADSPEQEASEKPSRRRRASRSNRKAQQDQTQAQEARENDADSTSVIDIVDAALARASEEDPDEPSGADHMPEVTTYEEALASFEANPRRKRKTRGNSKSDVPPRKEDFGAAAESTDTTEAPAAEEKPAQRRSRRGRTVVKQADEAPEVVDAGAQTDAPAEDEEQSTSSSRGKRGGRRRAVRSRAPKNTDADVKPQLQADQAADKSVDEAAVEDEAPAKETVRAKRGGRRRAVRKNVAAQESAGPETEEAPAQEEKKSTSRRRVARKRSSRSGEKAVTAETTVEKSDASKPAENSTRTRARGRRRAVRKES